nr:unnamed protein product [Callosobruchus chinensis]CAH7722245.1 unnamed protein product [Callosobruchus chinensis]
MAPSGFGKLFTTFCLALAIFSVLVSASGAAYRKPPFNGSIFGKRTNEIDGTSKALSAMCEIASEACQTWFPVQDK